MSGPDRSAPSGLILLVHLILIAIALALIILPARADAAESEKEFFLSIDSAFASGELSADQALLYKFQKVFEPELLPEKYRPQAGEILRCATPLMLEFEKMQKQLPADVRMQIQDFIQPQTNTLLKAGTYYSPAGYFQITYDTSGGGAVPAEDVDPANGIPDFVERIATYCDYSWELEVNTLGFAAPPRPTGYYQISFESMSSYGYTTVVSGTTTRIVLHKDFEGFPSNDDPEGIPIGAAKVTVAHEFKHACQRAESLWTEGGWVEVDATWMEDIAYDYVNDYYNYIASGSPISSPSLSLDSGGSGSYEDCVFQHWMSQTWTEQIITDLWTWRGDHTTEDMLDSYDAALQAYGSSLADGFPRFAAWNYSTGTRAITGIGYDEAADLITSPLTATYSSYPASGSGSVDHLAANLIRCTGLSGSPGTLNISFGRDTGSVLGVTAVILKTDGSGVLEDIPFVGDSADHDLSVPLDQIAEVGLAIGNGHQTAALGWSLTVTENQVLPQPLLELSTTSVNESVETGQTTSAGIQLDNTGDEGSVLSYQVMVMESIPSKRVLNKSVEGSTLTTAENNYINETTVDIDFTVTNASTDDEWLTDITMDFPTGVIVNSSTNFVGGTGGDLTTTGITGDGVSLAWYDADGSWGNIYGNDQQATATVNLTFSLELVGDVIIPFTVTGDEYGATPHSVSGNIVLTQEGATIHLVSPNTLQMVAAGANLPITWSTSGTISDVKIDLSRDNGGSWESITASTSNNGAYDWTATAPASARCLIRVSSLDDSASDLSEEAFTIYQTVDWLSVNPVSGDIDQGASQLLELAFDATSLPAGSYSAYVVILHNGSENAEIIPIGLEVTDEETSAPAYPPTFQLQANYPNPFNPTTSIRFSLEREGNVSLRVYTLSGERVATLRDGFLEVGEHTAHWNGTDQNGRQVASGVYLYQLVSADRTESRRMVLLK